MPSTAISSRTMVSEIAGAVAAVFGLLLVIWKQWISPKAKARRKAVKDGAQAADDLDPSGVTSAFDKIAWRKK